MLSILNLFQYHHGPNMQIVNCYDRWLEITHPTILSLNTTWPPRRLSDDETVVLCARTWPLTKNLKERQFTWQVLTGVTWPWHHHDISLPKTSQSQNPWWKCCWGVGWGFHWFWINYNTCNLAEPALTAWALTTKDQPQLRGCTGSDPKDTQISSNPKVPKLWWVDRHLTYHEIWITMENIPLISSFILSIAPLFIKDFGPTGHPSKWNSVSNIAIGLRRLSYLH